jgi:diguanylate cyclase (GGDEF)-like protein/PAS domain S-box-containing protein
MSENASDRTRGFLRSGKPLRNAKKLQRDSRAGMLHQAMLDRSPDLVFLLDADGRFIFINDAVERLLGYRKDRLVGEHYSRIVLEDDLELARNLFAGRSDDVQEAELRLRLHPSRAGPRPAQSTTVWTEIKVSHLDGADSELACVTARDISERREAQESLVFHAHHDWLTHLPNRVLLDDRLDLAVAQAQRDSRRLAVIFLDLDRFKLVNDQYGHTVGDRLLQAVAKRLRRCLGQGDTISRFGGDEFALLLPDILAKRDAVSAVRRVVRRIRNPFIVDGNELNVSASIGVAMYPEAGDTAEALMQSADIAMYRVKNRGGNGYRFFAGAMNRRLSRRIAMERELRAALAGDALSVYYQPRVHLETGTIVGVEALARWDRPSEGSPTDASGGSPGGIVEANTFLPVAEETGLISQIDAWVQRRAFEDAARWRSEGFKPCLSVNASAHQIEGGDFVQHIDELLKATGLPPYAVALEITEETLTRDIEAAVPKLDYLRRRGVRIVIDDFGAGYSSLSHLRRFPIDALKLDRRFVSGIDGGYTNIVEAIAGIAHGLRLDLMAEGVETRRQFAYLREHGCMEAQGFLFSRPMPADEMAAVLRADPYRSLHTIVDAPSAG